MFGHDGTTLGQHAFLRIHGPSNTVAVLLTNGGAAQDLMGRDIPRGRRACHGRRATAPAPAVGRKPGGLEQFAGIYRTVGGDTNISVRDGELFRESSLNLGSMVVREPLLPLRYAGGRTFLYRRPLTHSDVAVSFLDEDDQGRPRALFSGLRLALKIS